jgi:hypothetical protein
LSDPVVFFNRENRENKLFRFLNLFFVTIEATRLHNVSDFVKAVKQKIIKSNSKVIRFFGML